MVDKVLHECYHMILAICMLSSMFLFGSSLPHCFVEVVIDVAIDIALSGDETKKKLLSQAPQCATLDVIM